MNNEENLNVIILPPTRKKVENVFLLLKAFQDWEKARDIKENWL